MRWQMFGTYYPVYSVFLWPDVGHSTLLRLTAQLMDIDRSNGGVASLHVFTEIT